MASGSSSPPAAATSGSRRASALGSADLAREQQRQDASGDASHQQDLRADEQAEPVAPVQPRRDQRLLELGDGARRQQPAARDRAAHRGHVPRSSDRSSRRRLRRGVPPAPRRALRACAARAASPPPCAATAAAPRRAPSSAQAALASSSSLGVTTGCAGSASASRNARPRARARRCRASGARWTS